MKFRTKKFLKDRDESYHRSRNGELEKLNSVKGVPVHEEIKQKFKIYESILYDDIMKCLHRKMDIFESEVCDIPFAKRNGDMCKDCNLKLS